MKFLVAIALLALAVAEATHTSEHTLRGPRFKAGLQYKYNVEFNMTAGVPGMSSQVSASVLQAEVSIYAKTDSEHILRINNVRTSGSVKAIDNKYGDIPLQENRNLQDRLSSPIKFILEDGKVKSYTLSHKENLESKKIKKSILRSLEMYIPESAIHEIESPEHANSPCIYNTTEITESGVHITNYMIMVSPFVDFPSETSVYNISRIDNFEGGWYPSHRLHHNFERQGCSEVCRKEWINNEYSAGCPSGYEPHQSPIKKSFSHNHALSLVEGTLTPEVITTVEVHYAKMYDQDMEVLIRYRLTRTEFSHDAIEEEDGQDSHTDLDDMESEINVDEIDELCDYKKSDEAEKATENLLDTISTIIVEGELKEPRTALLGEKVILLRNVLSRLQLVELKTVAKKIKSLKALEFASDKEKVQRQVWLDILPLIGTEESVKFIVRYIQDEIKAKNMLTWEAKEILEALPVNVERPDAITIAEMRKLIQNSELLRKSNLLHSAVYLSLARVIGEVCGSVPIVRSSPKPSWFSMQEFSRSMKGPVTCPEREVTEIIKEITEKLKETRLPNEIAIYIETLTHTGIFDALSVVSDYVYGSAENIQPFGPRFIDFTKTIALHALHNIVGKYPEEVLEIVYPVFFNETETPKVRNAAFGVLIRCQPSLDILEKVATHSWLEKSLEVGSYVTSTLETFGNSSLPCMQLVSERIQLVMPQVRRFDVGLHHSKNYMWSYFDDLREFGLEGRLEYTQNNESFIPSTLYKSLSYSMGSLKDIIFQSSVNMEGLTQETILQKINEYLNIENIETIEREDEVFGEGKKGLSYLHPRTVDDLRLTTYNRLFYRSSFYYFDSSMLRSSILEFSKVFTAYFRKTETKYSGYFVKLFLPSYYHTVSIARTLPYPVEFQMRQPIVFALSVQTADSVMPPSRKHFDLKFKPSLYLNKLYTHQIKNIGDCKDVGVYHEHKIALTYPFQLKYDGMTFPNITTKYMVPPKSKRVLSYFTEAGTFAGKKELESLASTGDTEAIRTLPTLFKFEKDIHLVGIPPLRVELYTEDMNFLSQRLPRTPTEALDTIVKNILNAGWRHKSVNITILEDKNFWTGDSEATFNVEYSCKHVPRFTGEMSPQDFNMNQESAWNSASQRDSHWQRQSEDHFNAPRWNQDSRQSEDEDWSKYLKPIRIESLSEFSKNARAVSRILNYLLPHMSHLLNVSVTAKPLTSTAYLRMELNHTYERDLYSVHFDAASKRTQDQTAYELTLDHLMGYWKRPDELHYDTNYGEQRAGYLTAITLPPVEAPTCPWEKMQIAISGHMHYESNRKILEPELVDRVDDKYYLPETHEKCLSDVRDGNPLSVDCVKAIREYSLFNKLHMNVLWDEEIPQNLRQFVRVADVYLKHYFFEYMRLKAERNVPRAISIRMDYIDKFVDEPVVDLEIRKPSETLTLRRVPTGPIQPLSSVYGIYETSILEATNNSYLPTCVLMENYVKTYDLQTYPFAPKDCHYVLSTHCTKNKNFAVILRGTKEIYIYVASSTLVLTPKTGTAPYTVKYNGQDFELRNPILFHERDEIYAYTEHYERGHAHVKVIAKKAGISVLYDGRNVKIQVSPRYKGELCGLCSEFDGEELREFRGMDRCLYRDYVDFADSAIVKREGNCRVGQHLRDDRLCDSDTDNVFRKHPAFKSEGHEPTIPRNIVINRGNEVCFSVDPVPVCQDDDEPSETEFRRMNFHCLPKRDLTAKRMVTEAKWRPLEEVKRKSVDFVERVEVPKMC